ncbi:MAG TPA: beta-ketoacyl-[acyl-carrier-protein] synthase family protein [Vicinamibacterales bacterium]
MSRVAITGIGLVTGLGLTREQTWRGLTNGTCAVRPVTAFETDGYRSRVAAEVCIEGIEAQLSPLQRRRLSRGDQIGLVAANEAVEDAGLLTDSCDRERVGVLLGAGTADLLRNERFQHTMLFRGIEHARPSQAWNHFSSTPVDAIASHFGFGGLRSCIVAACSSSTIAIGRAADAIRSGRLDAALAGGTDAIARLTFSGFNALKLMDPEPCRPFSRDRAGMNLGEGAAILVLESFDRARARGAQIYGELAGSSFSCEAYHPTAPEPEGKPVAAVVRDALRDARVDASDVEHLNAHGTATPQNDRAETHGYRSLFGDRVAKIPVTSVKSMIGHCLGAAGGIEAAILALTVSRGVIPPTIHYTEIDPECPGDIVANDAREVRIRRGVSTSLGFGGNDSALVITAV